MGYLSVTPGRVQEQHNTPGFMTALAHYLNDLQLPELRLTCRKLSRTWLPIDWVDIYHKFQFTPCELSDGKVEVNVVKVIPGSSAKGRKSRFNTVILLDNDEAESTGVRGEQPAHYKCRHEGSQSQGGLQITPDSTSIARRWRHARMVAARAPCIRGMVCSIFPGPGSYVAPHVLREQATSKN
ncbi:uncharacterized protein B0H18DRAFT_951879 [Fomitopsis serialis]|uniref:uncharacterized protein n=1 Tax=Fomitopsis serialis TaxID=139415 RepID=UPI002007A0D9|nr:uncharacterized protein B0H18DRAFT_951879 [Neoantrodia serialis]KAH9933287.1 hypothetical protein B0H18DRAFT_951879 [Neoantrodia serialis]